MIKKRLFDICLGILVFLNIFFLSAVIFSQVILTGETVSLPDLSGKTVDQARSELARKDLVVVQKGWVFHDSTDRGRIVQQDPAPGSKLQVTKTVNVLVSAGSERVSVPAFEGRSLEASASFIRQSGLMRGPISQIHTPRYPAGRIIAQSPSPGTTVERNSAVGFLVSQGEREPRYLMPDLIGRKADRVVDRLRKLDFKVGDIRYAYYPGLEAGVVIGQYPPHGFRIQKRNLITLEVSR